MKKIYRVDFTKEYNGYYLFKLEQVMEDKKISFNQIMRDTNTDYKVIKRLGTGDLSNVNFDVLARLCNYLNCEVNEIFDFIKIKKDPK